MQKVPILLQKTAIRTRLIFACLTVSILVSAIYVTVSYRLAADVGIQNELARMSRVVTFLKKEIQTNEDAFFNGNYTFDPQNRLADPSLPTLFHVNAPQNQWTQAHLIDSLSIRNIVKRIDLLSEDSSSILTLDDRNYLWLNVTFGQYNIFYFKETTLIDATLQLVAKRLIITSVIVFWITGWLALTLSSIIAKRADEINASLAKLATNDPLTGLANRLYITEILHEISTNEHKRKMLSQACLFVIDLDKFKEVNDSFGHNTGDELLVELANRMSAILTLPNELIRIGGDEFIVWAPHCDAKKAEALAQALVQVCDTTVPLHGLEINTGASVGFAHYPSHTNNPETLISCADTAMYKAKKQRSGWAIYDNQNVLVNERDVMLRADLNNAMLNNELILHFQPKVDMRNCDIVGVEGLCRWQHPKFGLLTPFAFIHLIEHSGKVQDFGRYIIKKAIEHASSWRSEGFSTPIAINLSPYNLLDPGLSTFIQDELNQHQLPANLLQIELTENETCLNIKYIESALRKIRQLGIAIAIDDFGTGMSSLAYLNSLKANTIKIDKTFITDIETNKGHRAIVSSTVTLAESFECDVVVEGVETKRQADLLLSLGCFIAQGYFYAKPMPEYDMKCLLKNGMKLDTSVYAASIFEKY
ncbi:EAL domain-containing protein [Alteromonas sp. CI.11.F.A3]|uniref:putative bifunctional diguanylate cyclase/phosphodiesterase n=1 Tax=Alteromonas sp. CI.11.F.A3 TaxID=3079555 RepID=UPI002941E8F7|nr:EAL domain-containing protein [Alteromonas sp. CI.11.F.A3]WOI37411.1 EAL domain-containing protein [Alteromonas sp. CI.11.F.A3]